MPPAATSDTTALPELSAPDPSVLPTRVQAWPLPEKTFQMGPSLDFEEASFEEVRRYAMDKAWLWPARRILFFCDIHADTEAFLLSLGASGGIERAGPGDEDYQLTAPGREAIFIIGGDCFDKGPENLRLLRCLQHLIALGAEVNILAGNHDLRTYLGLHCAGRRETKPREMFLRGTGEFAWYFERMNLARQEGSFLFVHAGVDDAVARVLKSGGVDALNAWYRRLVDADLFELYHGPLGNTFRTKYRDIDFPLTPEGVANPSRPSTRED